MNPPPLPEPSFEEITPESLMKHCPEDFEDVPIYVRTGTGKLQPVIRVIYHDQADGQRVIVLSAEPLAR